MAAACVAGLMLVAGCGGETGSVSAGGKESTGLSVALVEETINELRNDPEITDPDRCPQIERTESTREIFDIQESARFECRDAEGLAISTDAAIYWELSSPEEAQEFVDTANTSSEFYLIDGAKVVDGPFFFEQGGMYGVEEFLNALSEKCGCGEVLPKP